MDVRIKIDNLRKQREWSMSKLAREIGISDTSVHNWYNENHYMPTVPVLEDVCEVFGRTMSELFADVESDKLTPKQLKLLSYFDKLSENKKDAVIEMVKQYGE